MSAPFALPVPELETQRLILRGPLEQDFEAHAEFMRSDRAAFVGGPQDRYAAWRGFCSSIGHWVLRGYGMWLVADKTDGTPLGRVGFINHEGWDEPELGWQVYTRAEGKGIAFEAASAARAYGAAHLGLNGVISYIDPENTRSAGLVQRLGATYESNRQFFGKPCQIWRHPKQGADA